MAALVSSGAFAQGVVSPPLTNTTPQGDGAEYWTPKRILDAKPIELTPAPGHRLAPAPTDSGSGKLVPGAPPTVTDTKALNRRLHAPISLTPEAVEPESSTRNTSSHGSYFTTSRVFPDAATSAWPYSMQGRLLFTNPRTGSGGVCSASVLRLRIVLTAGHCVYHAGPTQADPSTNKYWYTNFTFVPAFNNGAAPFGTWSPAWTIVSGYWVSGNGAVPNTQDIAMMDMNDLGGNKIGNVVGYFGYGTGGLSPNHLSIIGYPCNIDNCTRPQITNAQSFASGGSNTVVYGSAQRGGTSGGPWVQDFGVAGVGAPATTGGNYIRSVSSYGPTATEPKYLGGSILLSTGASTFGALLNAACARRAGNC